MSYALGVIIFVVALLTSVMLHEAGHFATAKAFGMKASKFFVGFGPTIWSFQRGETEYGFKAIPAGGFVKIEGMTQLEELDPADEDRAFWRQSAPKRTIVLAAGSFVHFIIAIVLTFGALALTHTDPIKEGPLTIAQVEHCLTTNGHCTAGAEAAPAYGKFRSGDVLVAVNGVHESYAKIAKTIQQSAGKQLTFTVRNGGTTRTVVVTPKKETTAGATEGKIGIESAPGIVHVSTARSFTRTFSVLGDYVKATGTALGQLPHEIDGIFHNRPTGTQGATSVVGVAEVSGSIFSTPGASLTDKIASIVLIIASLNLFVGIFNLLPLLPLDGGHVAILLFEQARTRIYRLIGRRDPGRVDLLKVVPVAYAAMAVMLFLSLLLIYSTIVHPVSV